MRGPIAYGLSWPQRIASGAAALNFHTLPAMTFEATDAHDHPRRFPGLQLAWEALRAPSGTCAVLNAANEIAVAAFLEKRIRFDQIHETNLATLTALTVTRPSCLDDLLALDASARQTAQALVQGMVR
jgi:1-deoxy-D-xylulose-5-phosphate reductoisomerase